MKRQGRVLRLRKMTLKAMEQTRGGFYSYQGGCSDSCNSCYWICGPVETDYCNLYSCNNDSCYYCY